MEITEKFHDATKLLQAADNKSETLEQLRTLNPIQC